MKVLITADIINNKIHVNNIYHLDFIGEIIIEYSNVIVYQKEIELQKNIIPWYSPYLKMIDISKIIVTLKEKNGNIFYSTTPIVYVTFMRSDNFELNNLCNFIKNDNNVINNIVEIGSYQGESTTMFAQNFKDSKIFAIDLWINNYDDREININAYNTIDIENNFDIMVRDYPNIIKIKMSSENFSNIIADNSIDFVYIDGDHSYKGISTDILKWKNKIKKGGYIGGHDYVEGQKDSVIRAIKENFSDYNINIFNDSWLIKL